MTTKLSATLAVLLLAAPAFAAAVPKEHIRVGFFGPMSGKFSLDGVQSKRGADLAVQEINAAGGIDGRPIELIVYDDRDEREEAVAIAHRLHESDRVVAVLGSAHSRSLVAAAPVFNEKKLPLLVTYASAFNVVKGYPYVYRWGELADVGGYLLAYYAIKEKGWKRLAVLVQDEDYGRGVTNGFLAGVKQWGGEVVFQKTFPLGEKEFRSYLTEIKSAKPDALLGTGFGMSHVSIVKQARQLGLFPAIQYLAPCTISEINFLNLAGVDGDGAIGTMEFLTGTENKELNAFLKRWIAKYGADVPVDHYAALNYESVKALAQAIKIGGTTSDGILKGLGSLKNFKTLDGSVVSMTAARELERTLDIGRFNAERKQFVLLKRISDPTMIDPSRWAADYSK